MNQYLKDKLEELERLGIDISGLPLGANIKDIEIGQDESNGRFYAIVTYTDKEGEEKKTKHDNAQDNQYNVEDIFR